MTEEEMLRLAILRGGDFKSMMAGGIGAQNAALNAAFARPDTTGLVNLGREREGVGAEQRTRGMLFAGAPREYQTLSQPNYSAGLAKEGPWEVGEGFYSQGKYTEDPFKRRAGLVKAMQAQGKAGGDFAGDFGREETAKYARAQSAASAEASRAQTAKTRQEIDLGKYGKIKGESGEETLYRVKPDGNIEYLGGPDTGAPGASAAPGGMIDPNAPGALPRVKLNDAQGKAMNYGARTAEAASIIDAIGAEYSPTSVSLKGGLQALPVAGGVLGYGYNQMMGKNEQKIEQAQRNFINAVLRRESGAVISKEEFANARHQYFPQPGDDPAVLTQKKQNRDMVIRNFAIESGPGRNEVMRVMQRGAPQGGAGGKPQRSLDDLKGQYGG